MLNRKVIFVGVLLAALAGPVSAHSDHVQMEPVTQQQASTNANKAVQNLVINKTLDASWSKVKALETTSRVTPAGTLWVVSYQNPQEKDATKQVLYVFLDDMGNIVAANHVGKL